MAKLVGNQAIKRAEEIATGKFEDEKAEDSLAEDEAARRRQGQGARRATAEKARPRTRRPSRQEVELRVRGTGYTARDEEAAGRWSTTPWAWSAEEEEVISPAISQFKQAVDMDPELHEARMNLAALSLNYRDYTTAEENFRAVLSRSPELRGRDWPGRRAARQQKFDEAEQQYKAAQKLDPAERDSYFNLGLLYQEYKDGQKPSLQKAQQYYREFLGQASAGRPRSSSVRPRSASRTSTTSIAALEEAAKMQNEAEEMQKKAEEQQKKMEEEMKKMEEQEKQQKADADAKSTADAQAKAAPAAGGRQGRRRCRSAAAARRRRQGRRRRGRRQARQKGRQEEEVKSYAAEP